MGLPSSSDDLIKDLSVFLMKTGCNTSFIDQDELIARGMKEPSWKLITRTILNPLSVENRIFQDNLKPIAEQTETYKINQKLQEQGFLKK